MAAVSFAPADLVTKVLREVLGADVPLAPDTDLFTVPGFDSLALAAVVEGLEAALGQELPDELMTPDAFATPHDIVSRVVAPMWTARERAASVSGTRSRLSDPAGGIES